MNIVDKTHAYFPFKWSCRTPFFYMSLVTVLMLGINLFGIQLALNQPSFDQHFSHDEKSVFMVSNAARGWRPASSVQPVIVKSIDGIAATPSLFIPDPDELPTYAQYNHFFDQQKLLFEAVQDGELLLELSSGIRLSVSPRTRTLTDLPLGFWIHLTAGSLALLISGFVWSVRPQLNSARAFFCCGFGFFLVCVTVGVYSLRELVMDPQIFLHLHQLNRLAVTMLTFAGVVLFWHVPKPLFHFPVSMALSVLVFGIWLNETMQVFSWPLHDYQTQFLVSSVLALLVGYAQWRRTENQALERASLRWILLSFLIFFTGIILLFILPKIFNPRQSISEEVASLISLCVFLGMALGISRYRIFELERWWLEAWIWFLGGFVIICVDIGLVSMLNLGSSSSLCLTVLLVGWFYFPARQWILRKFGGRQNEKIQYLLHDVVKFLVGKPSIEQQEQFWENLLQKAFLPLQLQHSSMLTSDTHISEHGLNLCVASVSRQHSLILKGCKRGQRLFSNEDIELALQLLRLLRYGGEQTQLRQQVEARERDRIMRDLHDDVCAKLLTLIHFAKDEHALLARSTLDSLRETIYSLQPNSGKSFEEFLQDLRAECVQRCESFGVILTWDVGQNAPFSTVLSAHTQINAARVVRELFTNIFKHAKAKNIFFSLCSSNNSAQIFIEDDGVLTEWKPVQGNGLSNMKRRSEELNGSLVFSVRAPHGVRVNFSFLMEEIDAISVNS